MMDETIMPAANTNAAITIVCVCGFCCEEIFRFLAKFDVSAGVGSSDIIVSSRQHRKCKKFH